MVNWITAPEFINKQISSEIINRICRTNYQYYLLSNENEYNLWNSITINRKYPLIRSPSSKLLWRLKFLNLSGMLRFVWVVESSAVEEKFPIILIVEKSLWRFDYFNDEWHVFDVLIILRQNISAWVYVKFREKRWEEFSAEFCLLNFYSCFSPLSIYL